MSSDPASIRPPSVRDPMPRVHRDASPRPAGPGLRRWSVAELIARASAGSGATAPRGVARRRIDIMTAQSALASSRRWTTDRASRLRRRSPSEPDRVEAPPKVAGRIGLLAVAGLPRILRSRPRPPRWLGAISAGVSDAEQTTFQRPSWRLAGALGYLWFDMAVLWIILKGVGEPISVPALVLAYSIGYLADTLPIPGGIGVLDAGLAGSLLLYGAPAAHVAAAVLVYHAIALWVPGLEDH